MENNVFDEDVEVIEPGTVFCHKCGTKNSANSVVCKHCGAKLHKENADNHKDEVRCPKCGSNNVEFVTYQASSNFDKGDACCGYLVCGPIGLLAGAKEKTPAKTVRKCKSCGHEF